MSDNSNSSSDYKYSPAKLRKGLYTAKSSASSGSNTPNEIFSNSSYSPAAIRKLVANPKQSKAFEQRARTGTRRMAVADADASRKVSRIARRKRSYSTSTNSVPRGERIDKLLANPKESRAYARAATKRRRLHEARVARETRKAYSGSTSINSLSRGERIDKLLANPKESRAYARAATRRRRHAEAEARRAAKLLANPKLSAKNSAEWKQAYGIINDAVKLTDALSEGLPGSALEEAKARLRVYFKIFSNTHLGDKLRKFVMSSKFKTARFQTRGEYRDEIKAAVLKQISPTHANYENI